MPIKRPSLDPAGPWSCRLELLTQSGHRHRLQCLHPFCSIVQWKLPLLSAAFLGVDGSRNLLTGAVALYICPDGHEPPGVGHTGLRWWPPTFKVGRKPHIPSLIRHESARLSAPCQAHPTPKVWLSRFTARGLAYAILYSLLLVPNLPLSNPASIRPIYRTKRNIMPRHDLRFSSTSISLCMLVSWPLALWLSTTTS